jgi:hypothetical protein
LIAYTEATPRIHPSDGSLIAGDSTAPAFQAAFIGKRDMLVSENIAIRGTGINTLIEFAFLTF